jgi:hypothetical protein
MSLCVYIEKIFSSNGPISIKLGTNHPWVNRIQNCTNQGPGPFQRGDNHNNAKMRWGDLKIFFSQATEPEELIFT